MRRRNYNDGSDIASTMNRAWDELHRPAKIDSMSRVLAYLLCKEGAEHETARAKELTEADWKTVEEVRPHVPVIRAKLLLDGPDMLKRNPTLASDDKHGPSLAYLHGWVYGKSDTKGRLRL